MSAITLETSSYSQEYFKATAPNAGQIMLLFDSSSVKPGEILSSSFWESKNISDQNVIGTGSLGKLKAVTISIVDRNGHPNTINLRVCKQVRVYTAQGTLNLLLNEESRRVYNNYAYFEVLPESSFIPFGDISASFQKVGVGDPENGNFKFVDYECNIGGSEVGSVTTLYPVFGLAYENSDFNPVLNNVTGSVANSYTKYVEVSRQVVSGSSRYLSYVEVTASAADIPDSFFTSLQNISGRSLGAKNGYYTHYLGNKEHFSNVNIDVYSTQQSGSPTRQKDLPFYCLQGFTGSIFPGGTEDEAIKAVNKSEMELEILSYSTTASTIISGNNPFTVHVGHLTVPVFSGSVVVSENNLPGQGSILYRNGAKQQERLPSVRVYSPDLGAALTTDDYGIVIDVTPIQVAD